MKFSLFSLLMLLTLASNASLEAPAGNFTSTAPATLALWENHPDWDDAALAVIRQRREDFARAEDIGAFCPGYKSASLSQQEGCLLRLVSALVKKESDFDARAFTPEDKGLPSVGLMMLSRGECANAPTEAELKNAVKNLTCGINKLADQIKKGNCISCLAGGGAYWSALRAPYTYRTRSGQLLHLGKRDEIARLTKNYRTLAPVQSNDSTVMVAEVATEQITPAAMEAPAHLAELEVPTELTEPVDAAAPTWNNELWNMNWSASSR
jgi:hypothetical protein